MLAERMELLTKRPQGTLFPPAQNRAAWEALPADDRMDMETVSYTHLTLPTT
mgnify:CR=1 FL=1